jgi:hypothetical protein
MSSKKIGQIRRSDRRNVLLARKGHNVLGVDRAISERHRFNSFHVAENDSISRKVGIVGQAFPLTTG